MNPSRRRFLKQTGGLVTRQALGVPLPPGLKAGFDLVAGGAAPAALIPAGDHWELGTLMMFADQFSSGLSFARAAAKAGDAMQFAFGMDDALQTLLFFHVNEPLQHLHWADVIADESAVHGIFRHSPANFLSPEETRAHMLRVLEHPEFSGMSRIGDMLPILQSRVQGLYRDNAHLFEGFDWLEFARITDDEIKAVYQPLLQLEGVLPPSVRSSLEAAYQTLSFEADQSCLHSWALAQAPRLLARLISEKNEPPPPWRVVMVPSEWQDEGVRFRVEPLSDDPAQQRIVLETFQSDLIQKHGVGNFRFVSPPFDAQSGPLFLSFVPSECIEGDIEDLLILSRMRSDPGFLSEMAQAAAAQEAKNNPQELTVSAVPPPLPAACPVPG